MTQHQHQHQHGLRVSMDVSTVPARPGGAGRYVIELARQLAMRDDLGLSLISRGEDAIRWEMLPGNASVENVAPRQRLFRLAWEQLRLPQVLRALEPDAHHGPHYTAPRRTKVPTVVTIHDMTFFDHPEWHERVKVAFFRRAIESSVRSASALIAVSHDTERRVKNRFGDDIDIAVIPHGIDHEMFRPRHHDLAAAQHPDPDVGTDSVGDPDARLLADTGISGRFVAFVGTLEPRKDVPTLLRAFDVIADDHSDVTLVLAGSPGWGMDQVTDTLGKMRHKDRVIQTGFLPDATIVALLRLASVVAYPSLMEGFGLPALEALACGAVLVTTRGSAMEEVVGDAALLIEAGDVAALADCLNRALGDDELTKRLRVRGPEIAQNYTWNLSAARHIEVYKQAASR